MSESKAKQTRQQKLIADNPLCYLCGGANAATSVYHVPPKACFADRYFPEGFEFSACDACNQGAKKYDQIFGFHSLLLDFDRSKFEQEEQIEKLRRLGAGIKENYPEALPDITKATEIRQIGLIATPKPVAISVETTALFKEAIGVMGTKLTHALYYRETKKILMDKHRFLVSLYQPQRGGTEELTEYFASVLPWLTVGGRTSVKEYGDRFRYLWGEKESGELFVFAAQFGHGLILWGIACGATVEKPTAGPLADAEWFQCACGPIPVALTASIEANAPHEAKASAS